MLYFKRVLFFLLAFLAIIFATSGCFQGKDSKPVNETQTTDYELQSLSVGDEIVIDFAVTADWSAGNGLRGYTASITITNNRAEDINGWTLAYNLNGEVTGMWNSSYVQDDNTITATNASWNSTISANGGMRNLGFEGTYEGPELLASAFSLNGEVIGDQEPLEPPPSPNPFVEVTLVKTSEWSTGSDQYSFNADITIINNSNQIIDPWVLEFDFAGGITQVWNGNHQADQTDPFHHTVNHASWNSRIEPNSSRSFGFQGNYTGSSFPELLNILLNGEPIGEAALPDLPEPWQRATLGAGRVFSEYKEDTKSFTLQVQPYRYR